MTEPEFDGIVLTEEDIKIIFGSPPVAPGVIYYDARSGAIRGVSHGVDADLSARLESIEVDPEIVARFMNGEVDIAQWFVGYQGQNAALLPTNPERLTIVPSKHGLEVVTDSAPAPVRLIIAAPPGESHGSLTLVPPLGAIIDAGFTEPFRIILTKRGSLDEVIANLVIDPAELFAGGELEVEFAQTIVGEVDVLTSPLTSVQYVVQPFMEASRPLDVPVGRFIDLVPFQGVTSVLDRKAGLVVDYTGQSVVVRLHEGGGRYYDRPLSALLVAISRPGDREAMLWSGRVSLEDLRSGPVTFTADEIEGPFEVVSQLYFENTYSRDLRAMHDDESVPSGPDLKPAVELVDERNSGLLIEVDRKGRLNLALLNGGGRLYAREPVEWMMVSFCRPESPEMVLWATKVSVDELSRVMSKIDIPPELCEQPFVIYTQHVFVNTFWRFAAK